MILREAAEYARSAGQLVNFQSIANDIGVSMPTVKGWVSILEACFIVTVLPCYYRNFGKRFVKAPKKERDGPRKVPPRIVV